MGITREEQLKLCEEVGTMLQDYRKVFDNFILNKNTPMTIYIDIGNFRYFLCVEESSFSSQYYLEFHIIIKQNDNDNELKFEEPIFKIKNKLEDVEEFLKSLNKSLTDFLIQQVYYDGENNGFNYSKMYQ